MPWDPELTRRVAHVPPVSVQDSLEARQLTRVAQQPSGASAFEGRRRSMRGALDFGERAHARADGGRTAVSFGLESSR